MNDLETWFDNRLGFLIEPTWPRMAQSFVDLAIQERKELACWLMKSAVTFDFGAMKRRLPVEFPSDALCTIRQGTIPDHCWIDLGFSQVSNVGATIGRFFRTVNGGVYNPGEVCTKFSFHFVLQMNHLLLRLGRAPGSMVDYDPHFGPRPIRIYPDPDWGTSSVPEFRDFMSFHHSLVLTTWEGCAGNISGQATDG